MTTSVERYLESLAAQDWDGVAATLADKGVTRSGPFGDDIEGKTAYVDFLRGIVPILKDYELEVKRVSHVSDRVAFVELSETFDVDGTRTEHPECLLFERDATGLINHVSVFLKQLGGDAPVEGGRAS